MKRKLLIIITLLLLWTPCLLSAKEMIYKPALFTYGKFYMANDTELNENELENHRIYAEVTYNSKGKILEESFYISKILVCKRIYSPRFDRALREEYYKWDKMGNKTTFETKNYYGEKFSIKEKTITSVIYESISGNKKSLYVEYELFSEINGIESKRIKQSYENGKLKKTLLYYYDSDGTLVVIEERNVDNVIMRIGRPDYARLLVGVGDVHEAIMWTKVD